MSNQYKKMLVLPHIRIHNANALSSPFTIGFPAMTSWLGATHALQRKLNEQGIAVGFSATGVVSHQMDLQTYRGENDFVSYIAGTGNPLDKNCSRSSFIVEARCHLDISLLVELVGINQEQENMLKDQITHLLNTRIKIAGGDIQTFNIPEILVVKEGDETDLRKMMRKLTPGYVLIERRDLMIEAMEQGQDALEALIDYLAIHHSCEQNDKGEVTWSRARKARKDKPSGWIVPIATGFHGISELGKAKNQRDPEIHHRFAESLVTLGEFKMPHRFNTVDSLLWHCYTDKENYLYQCRQVESNQFHHVAETIEEEFS